MTTDRHPSGPDDAERRRNADRPETPAPSRHGPRDREGARESGPVTDRSAARAAASDGPVDGNGEGLVNRDTAGDERPEVGAPEGSSKPPPAAEPAGRNDPAAGPGVDDAGTSHTRRDPSDPSGPGTAEPPDTARDPAAGGGAVDHDVQTLRQLLHESVGGIEPAPNALQALREAVPARRRRRQRVAAAATTVAVLAVGTPVTLQAASVGDTNDRPTEASTETSDGSTGTDGTTGDGPGTYDTDGTGAAGGGPVGEAEAPGTPSPDDSSETGELDAGEDDPLAASYPRCDRDQLGDVHTAVDDPVDGGLIYGSITLRNVSDSPCRIRGTDELTATPAGGEDDSGASASVNVVERVEGDRATDLPLEEEWHEELLLRPGEAYEVGFAWVPRGGDGCAVPVPEGPGDSGGGEGSDGDDKEDTAPLDLGDDKDGGGSDEDGDGESGSGGSGGTGGEGDEEDTDGVVIRYTPAAGQPRAARFELESSCAGSLHRTGVLESSED